MAAFTSSQTGANEIWVKPAVGGDQIQVTKNGFYNQYPIWSPNGEEIAFFSSRGGSHGIWKTAFTGGQQSRIVAGVGPTARPVYWAKSGRIYYQEGSEIVSIAEGSTEPAKVTDLASLNITPRMIEVSPDETTVAYSVKEKDFWKVKIAADRRRRCY